MDPIFPFPFKPYDIQNKFMRELYLTLENKKCGIFESPTGTGKSLSICCSALQWLRDTNQKHLEDLEKQVAQLKTDISSNTDSNDWLQEEYEKIQKNQTLVALQLKLDKIKKQKELFDQMKIRVSKHKSTLANKNTEYYFKKKGKNEEPEKDMENIKEETESEGDRDLLLEELEDKDEDNVEDECDEPGDDSDDNTTKIYISSRTHSQLSQFIGEIKRTVFKDDTRVVTLASRQHYCINSDVTKLKNVNLINERCLDMQKSKTKLTSVGEEGKVLKKTRTRSCPACPYYNQSNITKMKERMLVEIMDMEDLLKCAKELKACPYYASRMAVDDAEVVLISHAGIARAGAGRGARLRLRGAALLLDEAHALGAALRASHEAPLARAQLDALRAYLRFYVDKYRARLSSRNLLTLNQIIFVVGKLSGMIKPNDKKQDETTIFTLEDFVIKAEIDHMNLRPLVEFCRNTRLAPKLHGFSMRYSQQALEEEMTKRTATKKSSFEMFMSNISKKKMDQVNEVQLEVKPASEISVNTVTQTSAGSALYAVLEFLQRLCERSELGRVLARSQPHNGHLKYLLLNPAEHFSEVVKQCRSVIVAGGTMEPISEFEALLGGDGSRGPARVLRCGHVVPPAHVLGLCLSKGPANVTLNYSYANRMSDALLSETGRILRNLCSVVPGGVVCFLPSYSYEQTVYEHLKTSKVIEAISKKKSIFREPKSASDVDQVLTKFAAAVSNKSAGQTGALLLSVVGGKLSEGLNFSDDLGRCVMVVGMPYPNATSAELQEQMSYLDRTGGAGAGSLYYENLCMKAVNQCVGRAVRHAQDYACVVLVDERYSRPQITSALPSFVQKSLITNCNFGMSIGNIAKFFARHKDKKT